MSDSSPNVTQLLVAWGKGDQHAFDALMPEVRKELHRLAAHYMAEESPGHDLQPTALIAGIPPTCKTLPQISSSLFCRARFY